ncbi:MAG: hypothetical protein JGK24_06820 [Microcoleus sp. PH2017_29_MFU_D_A]|uniref:hypothetical protein n=1 Tax=unclassified Microcoleus TaxID=2642155 RepID=UPI001D55BF12|nr:MULTISPECIES: hypothetical protein [unclassified Microcoleus]MCC3583796.1 hypothetical protein [Microcoleus sp. PH2017_30_WIL_O_A]MCC3593045.1 hypothetical protein [Microcoleus sp. PH2017_28_MFU_U_A]MCC3602945.1 hypothetical protein [Microcoleus sp. PH2017_29_MFU_D_A]MCC3634152.1 hypothetical protein [Microcoleus sp. PH2017_37_MFU_D_B]
MKAEIRICSLAVTWILGAGAHLALALPVANQQGDYTGLLARQRGNRQVNWVVVDSDSQGLNCRMAQRFRSVSVDALDAPDELFEKNKHNVSQWPVVTTFRRGQRLQAVTGNNANQIMIADSQGKPWLPISTDKGNCFVRANSRFVKPIRENPTTLKPLE